MVGIVVGGGGVAGGIAFDSGRAGFFLIGNRIRKEELELCNTGERRSLQTQRNPTDLDGQVTSIEQASSGSLAAA